MSLSTEPRTLPERTIVRPSRAADRRPPDARPATSLYRVVWRWHFYAGLFVAPVLIVMAGTGALYVFKDELEGLIHARMLFVTPSESRASYDEQLAIARAALPAGYEVSQLIVPSDPSHSTEIYADNGVDYRRVLVDPYRGELLGVLGPDDIFPVILKIHRTLFAGTLGRIMVELTTCWTIVLLITGVYLWWPRKRSKLWGAWLPRLKRHPYVALRDLHAVSGVYVAAVAFVVAATGLIYTYVWGQGYQFAALKSGAYDIYVNPPKSHSPAEAPRLPLHKIVAIGAEAMPGKTLSVLQPHDPDDAFIVLGTPKMGPTSDAVAIIDHATGEIIAQRTNSQFPALAWWATWNYPLHVGSVLGWWTKVPWLVVSLVLMLMPVTGVWMWWQRRPRGRTGFPRRPQVRISRVLVLGVLSLAVVLPVLGLSIVAILLGEKGVSLIRWKCLAANA